MTKPHSFQTAERTMTSHQQHQLELLVDSCGLQLVLGGLANICADKSAHVLENWQDRALSVAWMRAMDRLDDWSCHPAVANLP